MSLAPTVIDLIRAYRAHDEYAATLLYRRYALSLQRFADRQIGSLLRQAISAEDVVQVVFQAFFQHVRSGRYHFTEARRVWHLLATMTRNRVRYLA